MAERSPRNLFRQIARKRNRNYITPEDVGTALLGYRLERVRCDLLAVIGNQTDLGIEDVGLCAFIAWRGNRSLDEKGRSNA